MKYLIINADDFGNYSAVNKGIIQGIKNRVITSTSVMVLRKRAKESKSLTLFSNISVGLHFELPKGETPVTEEFDKQVRIFTELLGRKPDHIDSHKIRPKNIVGFTDYLETYSQKNGTPIRDWGHANLIENFFGLKLEGTGTLDLTRITPEGLIRTLDGGLKEGYNELMTHAGHVDNEVRASTSYGQPREIELQSLLSPEFRDYLASNPDIQLVSWKEVRLHI